MNFLIYKILFIAKDNFTNILRSVVSSFGILFLITFFVIYISLRDSVTSYVKGNLFENLASDEIKILPQNTKEIEFVKRQGSRSIPLSTATTIRKMPDFVSVHGVSRIGFTLRIEGEMLGKTKRMYVPVCGVDRDFLKTRTKKWKSFTNRKPVPIIAPKFTIDMLNNYFAMDNIDPIPESELIGFPLTLTFATGARNTDERKTYDYEAEIHSFTDVINIPGVIVPTDFLRELAQKYYAENKKSAGMEYAVLFAKVKDTDKLPQTVEELKKMGLNVQSQKDVTEKTSKAMKIIDSFSLGVIAIFFLLTSVSIFNSYLTIVYIRSKKFSLKRILGYSKLRILFGFIFESACVGALYGLAGYFTGNMIIRYFSVKIPQFLPSLGSITLAESGTETLFLCIVISSAVSAVSALIPAIFASNINLFKAVRR